MTSSVRESRAGDDFHLLWAARRALALLDPRSALQLVRLEGLNPADAEEGDDHFLGVDLTEYYGGRTLADAARVATAQLKYSVKHPDRAWTAARLAARPRKGGTPVVRRLAEIFSGLIDEGQGGGGQAAIGKISIQLVSNQPAARDLIAALRSVQEALADLPFDTETSRATRSLTTEAKDLIVQLQHASGLPSARFSAFLRVLDLSACGSDPRSLQRIRLSQELGTLIVGPHRDGLAALLEFVRSQVLPEAATSPGIDRSDVLAALGTPSADDFLPAPPRFRTPQEVVPTPEPAALATVLIDSPTRIVLAHGAAGIGKTTTVLGLEKELPAGSIVIPCDCFGAGDYLSPGEERHSARRALVQMANELSLRLGIEPLLLSSGAVETDIWRRFTRRLEAASAALEPDAVLAVVIDAADNAVYAASRRGGRSFVGDMWHVNLPQNVRLLMTCRTHRRSDVAAPPEVTQYALNGFDPNASLRLLRSRFPIATATEGQLFHERTNGVPRVQSYVLASAPGDDLDRVLVRAKKGLREIFDDVFRAAVEERLERRDAERHLAILFASTRPVRMSTLGHVLSMPRGDVRDMVSALEPGVAVSGDHVHFPDEDFEHFLRDRISENDLTEAHARLADYFMDRRLVDGDAATQLAEHLKEAGRNRVLIELALEEPVPQAITDGVARALAARRRVGFALEGAADGTFEQRLQLLLVAAQVLRSDSTLVEVIRSRPELAALFANSEAVASIYLREASEPWLGPAHLHVASVLAWDAATTAQAKTHLNQARAWFRRWSLLEEDERRNWGLDAEDLARGAAACWALGGVPAAADFLARWRPASTVASAVEAMAPLVAPHITVASAARGLRQVRASTWVEAQFIVSLSDNGKAIPRAWVDRVARRLVKMPLRHPVLASPRRPAWGVTFAEAAAHAGVARRIVADLLERFGVPLRAHPPSEWDTLASWTLPLRSLCLAAAIKRTTLTTDDLLPEELRADPNRKPHEYDPNEGKRRSFREALEPYLPIFQARAEGLLAPVAPQQALLAVEDGIKWFRDQAKSPWFRTRSRYRTWSMAATDVVLASVGDAEAKEWLVRIASVGAEILPRLAPYYIELAEALVRRQRHSDLALRLLEDAGEEVRSKAESASDRRDALLTAAATAWNLDRNASAEFFSEAVDAAQGIDDDVAARLAMLARTAVVAAPGLSAENATLLSARLAATTDAIAPYVSDPDEVLPVAQVLATVTRLWPPSGFALAGRWDDEGRQSIDSSIPIVVRHASEAGWLEPERGLSLLGLSGADHARVRSATALLDRMLAGGPATRDTLVRSVTLVAAWVGREVRFDNRPQVAGHVTRWAAEAGMCELTPVRQLADLVALTQSSEDSDHDDTRLRPKRLRAATDAADRRPGPEADLGKQVRWMRDHFVGERELADHLTSLIADAPPQRRVEAVERVVQLATEFPNSRHVISAVVRALRSALERWPTSTRLRTWADKNVTAFIDRHLPRLFSLESPQYGGWVSVFQPPIRVTRDDLARISVACALNLEELTSADLFAIVEAFAPVATSDELASLLAANLESVVPSVSSALDSVAGDSASVVAALLWALLGHADLRVRWRAAHTVRALIVNLGWHAVADELVDRLNKTTAHPYAAAGGTFFYLSARTWALMAIARVAGDAPQVLREHAVKLAAIATDRDLPHVVAREFARRAALRIVALAPSALPQELQDQLHSTNLPRACQAERTHRAAGLSSWASEATKTRLGFDTMDTLRYWYEPLARVFGLTTVDIAHRADRWVTDVWGGTEEECRRFDRHDSDAYDWQLRHNDHGELPLVETLRTYLEYHAMLVVAGELTDEGAAIAVGPYDDPGDPWTDWLSSYLDADPSCWLADRRSATPLEPGCYGRPPSRASFEREGTKAFDALLGLRTEGPQRLVVEGSLSTTDDAHYIELSVASALVSPETATALLRALQSAPPRDFRLPYRGEGSEYGHFEVDESGFLLLGWLDELRTPSDALDAKDPTATTLASRRIIPCRDFLDFHGLTADATGCRFSKGGRQEAVRLILWDDGTRPGGREDGHRTTKGFRTWVDMDSILGYLERRGLDLILEAQVYMFPKSGGRALSDEEEDSLRYEASRIYVLRSDGCIETIEGYRRPRQENRPRART